MERLKKEVTESLVKYVKLNDEYSAKLPKANKDIPSWVLNLDALEELDKMGEAVKEAQNEWISNLGEYIERKK